MPRWSDSALPGLDSVDFSISIGSAGPYKLKKTLRNDMMDRERGGITSGSDCSIESRVEMATNLRHDKHLLPQILQVHSRPDETWIIDIAPTEYCEPVLSRG